MGGVVFGSDASGPGTRLRDHPRHRLRNKEPAMKKHEILSPQSRAALFDPPTDPAEIVRHYTSSPEDLVASVVESVAVF